MARRVFSSFASTRWAFVSVLVLLFQVVVLIGSSRSAPASLAEETDSANPDCVVVGDIHGCLTNLKRVLAQSGVLDEETKSVWVFGNRTVVQVGDMLDRGHDDPAVLDFVQDMIQQAEASGGRWVQVSFGFGALQLLRPNCAERRGCRGRMGARATKKGTELGYARRT